MAVAITRNAAKLAETAAAMVVVAELGLVGMPVALVVGSSAYRIP